VKDNIQLSKISNSVKEGVVSIKQKTSLLVNDVKGVANNFSHPFNKDKTTEFVQDFKEMITDVSKTVRKEVKTASDSFKSTPAPPVKKMVSIRQAPLKPVAAAVPNMNQGGVVPPPTSQNVENKKMIINIEFEKEITRIEKEIAEIQ